MSHLSIDELNNIIDQMELDCIQIQKDCEEIRKDHEEIRRDHEEIRKDHEEIRAMIGDENKFNQSILESNKVFFDQFPKYFLPTTTIF